MAGFLWIFISLQSHNKKVKKNLQEEEEEKYLIDIFK